MTGESLIGLTTELMEIQSVSRNESEIAGFVEDRLKRSTWLSVSRFGDTVVATSHGSKTKRILLAGHLDTVPPSDGQSIRKEGERLFGLGASDMKGGLAVLLELATGPAPTKYETTFVFYACEEVDKSENSLRNLALDHPSILGCDAAILCEPTSARIEAGCQGSMRLAVVVAGKRAHVARPWMGENAIHRSAQVVSAITGYENRIVNLDDCEYRESTQVVALHGGVAGNVIPDEAMVTINHRFAPDVSGEEAYERLVSAIEPHLGKPGDKVEILDLTIGCPPGLSDPILRELSSLSESKPVGKLGLTDASLFAELGIPATNFGPGNSELAHTPHEFVTESELERAYDVLSKLLSGDS